MKFIIADCNHHIMEIVPMIFSVSNFPSKLNSVDGWIDELGFYVPSTVFQSFRDDGRVNMKGSVQ